MSLRTLWYYLTSYSSALTALASLVGVVLAFLAVVVAAVYAVLTRRLAQAATVQAEAAREQAEAGRKAADAAADQARCMRLIFEAAHRPYLAAAIGDYFFDSLDNFRISFTVKNGGPVPGVLAGWRAAVRVTGVGAGIAERAPQPADGGICVFPDTVEDLEFSVNFRGGAIRSLPDGIEIDFTLEYRGLSEAGYSTSLTAKSRGGALERTSQQVQ